MMARVALAVDAEAEAAFPALRGAEVTVTTRDGARRSQRLRTRRGDPDFPMSDKDLEVKFHMLAAPVIGAGAAQALARVLGRVETLETLSAIPSAGRVAPGAS
jgi:2-methylcitrate dehydratase PrpD